MLKFLFFLSLICFLLFNPSLSSAGEITSPFGWRIHPISGEWSFHSGVDIAYDAGTPIGALMDGAVFYSGVYGGYGNCVVLEHPSGDYTLYAHFESLSVSVGDKVSSGDIIGYVGSTGVSTGPHLHLEWWRGDEYIDPLGLLNQ